MDDIGSDHELLAIALSVEPVITVMNSRPKWKFGGNKEWQTWSKSLPNINSSEDVLDDYKSFTNNLISTIEKMFSKTSGIINPKFSKPWWNDA